MQSVCKVRPPRSMRFTETATVQPAFHSLGTLQTERAGSITAAHQSSATTNRESFEPRRNIPTRAAHGGWCLASTSCVGHQHARRDV